MLERPSITDAEIITCLKNAYGILVCRLEFLPLGADGNTAVFRAEANNQVFFVKLRSGAFDECSVAIPDFLSVEGIKEIISPVRSYHDLLHTRLGKYELIVYPFVDGLDGYNRSLSAKQWKQYGAALRAIHDAALPEQLKAILPVETYANQCRSAVHFYQKMAETQEFIDPHAREFAAAMCEHRQEIDQLLDRTEQLAAFLGKLPASNVLCHTDLHAGNLHITAGDDFFIVDWDAPLLAPRERDLMYPGSGLNGLASRPDEERLFFQGYGSVSICREALAYYRMERIIADIAAYGEQLLLSDEGGADRAQSIEYFKSNFLTASTLEIAVKSDPSYHSR